MTTGGSRPRRRGLLPAVVLAGLLLGGAGGWAVAALARPGPVTTSTRPLPAANPDVPSPLESGSDRPALSPDPPYVDDTVSFGTDWTLQRPAGWERLPVSRGIRWVLPGNPEWTYSVRVVNTTGSSSTAQSARGRLADIREQAADGNLADVELVELTDDAVMLTYVQDGHLKYQRSQFVPATATSDTAVFEVSTSGRIEDRPGLDAMAEHMAASVRRG